MTEYRVSLRIEKVIYGKEGEIVDLDPNCASRVLNVCEDENAAKELFAEAVYRHYSA